MVSEKWIIEKQGLGKLTFDELLLCQKHGRQASHAALTVNSHAPMQQAICMPSMRSTSCAWGPM